MPQYLSPVCNDQTIDANGDPLVGGQIETYLAGSSTPAATYTDDSGSTPHSNPIILNSLGYPTQGSIWLTGGVSYKFIIKSAAGVTLRTIDEIAGINDATLSQSEWLESGFTPTYINGTTFSVPGDQTGTLQINRRVRTQNTSGFIYSSISNSVFAAGITTVTLINSSGVLDAGLSSVAYALLSADNPSLPTISVTNFNMTTGGVLGRIAAGTGPVQVLTPAQSSTLATTKIQPLSTAVGSNALTITLSPTTIDFRSTTLASGTVSTVYMPSAITLTVSPGSTLGTTNGILARLAILAINNAGTAELAIVNLAGGVNLNESGVISTTAEGGAGGADSVSTIYSTTARSSVVYRLLGFIESTQTTAGTWAALPSLVNATSSPLAMWTSGYGKLWQDLTGSRSLGTGYTNSTGREIEVNVQIGNGAATPHVAIATVNGVTLFGSSYTTSGSSTCAITFKVPPGGSYLANGNLGTPSLSTWNEYR